MTKHKLRLAFGASLSNFTEENVKRMVEMEVTELILTSPDLKPYPDFVFLAKKYGCKAGYDMEVELWAKYFPDPPWLNLSTYDYQDKFLKIKNAGYDFAISEGLKTDMPFQIKKSGLPYYNMGGENGENIYTSPNY